MLWIAGGLTFLVLFAGARLVAASTVAEGRFANLVEALMEFVRENIAEEFLGPHAKRWFGFIAALFFFILFANLLGKLPAPPLFHHASRRSRRDRGRAGGGRRRPGGPARLRIADQQHQRDRAMAGLVFVVAAVAGVLKLGSDRSWPGSFCCRARRWWCR